MVPGYADDVCLFSEEHRVSSGLFWRIEELELVELRRLPVVVFYPFYNEALVEFKPAEGEGSVSNRIVYVRILANFIPVDLAGHAATVVGTPVTPGEVRFVQLPHKLIIILTSK